MENMDTEIVQWVIFAKGMNESLADVIRHDQDHDDWHAMHGDAPCTSEANCAAKRAKYDEVKAEAGVQKGDTPGHPFRGNQYAQVATEHAEEHREFAGQHMERANALARAAGEHLQFSDDPQLAHFTLDKANEHEAAANAHLAAAKAWDGVVQSGDTAEANSAQALSTKAFEASDVSGGVSKSAGEIQKSNFPDARIPEDMDTDNGITSASKDLMDNARAIITIHEDAAMGKIKHLTSDDFQALAERHDELAKAHETVALMLKGLDPVRNIQSISAHGDAMGAHEDAAKTCEMMTNTHYDNQWDGHHGQMRPAHGANANKVWRKAHRAFLMSQMAFNRTNFDTGVVVKAANDLGNLVLMAEKAAEDGDMYRKQSADAYAAGDPDKAGSLSILAMDAYKMAHNFLRTATATVIAGESPLNQNNL